MPPIDYVMRDAEIKFTSVAPTPGSDEPQSQNINLCLVLDGHPQRKHLTEAIYSIVDNEPEMSRELFHSVRWATPLRKASPREERADQDMRDYLTTRLSRGNCPMDVNGDGSVIGHAKDHLWPGCLVDLNLKIMSHWIQPPPRVSLPPKIFMVSVYVLGVRHAGGVPLRLRCLQPKAPVSLAQADSAPAREPYSIGNTGL